MMLGPYSDLPKLLLEETQSFLGIENNFNVMMPYVNIDKGTFLRTVDIVCIVRTKWVENSVELFAESNKKISIQVLFNIVPRSQLSDNVENLLLAFNTIDNEAQMFSFLKSFDILTDIKKPAFGAYDNCND